MANRIARLRTIQAGLARGQSGQAAATTVGRGARVRAFDFNEPISLDYPGEARLPHGSRAGPARATSLPWQAFEAGADGAVEEFAPPEGALDTVAEEEAAEEAATEGRAAGPADETGVPPEPLEHEDEAASDTRATGPADEPDGSDDAPLEGDLAALVAEQRARYPRSPDSPETPADAPPPSPEPARPSAHAVFDRMGQGMPFANQFTLPPVTLGRVFQELDREIDRQAEPRSEPGGALDEAELARDLAAIRDSAGGRWGSDAALAPPSTPPEPDSPPAPDVATTTVDTERSADAPSAGAGGDAEPHAEAAIGGEGEGEGEEESVERGTGEGSREEVAVPEAATGEGEPS